MPHPDLGGYVLGGLTDEERVRFEADLARDPTLRRDVDDLAGLPHLLDLAALVDGDGDDDVDVPAHVVAMTRSTAAVDVQPRRRMGPLLAAVAAVAMLLGLAGGVLAGRDHAPRADREVALVVVDSTAASSARGSAALFRQSVGVGVRLRLSGLSPTEPGSRYECWWIGLTGGSRPALSKLAPTARPMSA